VNAQPDQPFGLRGRETLEAFLASESDESASGAVIRFVMALQTDPRGTPGTPLPGSQLNEVCRLLPDHDIAMTWIVVWGEKVIWLRRAERVPAFP